ncbi:MAG: hypothetical protein H7A00_08570 [Hahellaceae bacterium]|nr:hypothetical protein [Hahellaceae bacterium]
MTAKDRIVSGVSWLIVLWIAKVFLFSLPYKFTGHPDTLHIFGTIGGWMQQAVGEALGSWFIAYGAYAVGSAELFISVLLLSPLVFCGLKQLNLVQRIPSRHLIHGFGGLLASCVMMGAVFFHLATPLGIEVIHEGQNDHGSLFYAAVSILILGLVMFVVNMPWRHIGK